MTVIVQTNQNTLLANQPALHPVDGCWQHVMAQLSAVLLARAVHPSRVVVLVPYAQLMQQARSAWAAFVVNTGGAACFTPRFETTMNWASTLSAREALFVHSADDMQLDAAADVLTAAALLERVGLGAQKNALAGRLMESAWSLSRVAAAQPPDKRIAWGVQLAEQLGIGLDAQALAFELALAQMALAWAAASSYPSDVFFSESAKEQLDLLVVLEGFQNEPLVKALQTHFEGATVSIKLGISDVPGLLAMHVAQDAEDEAHLAAACVMAHLAQGRRPVALIAQDRVLTRRIHAMLTEHHVTLRDETGWKLSTTRMAATLMSLLRIVPWDASTDTVLDWLKNAPAFNAAMVCRLEIKLRQIGVRFWRALPALDADLQALTAQVKLVRDALQKARPLAHWLRDLRSALQGSGQWGALSVDAAGKEVIKALRLLEGLDTTWTPARSMSLQDFTGWVNQTLEAASFIPEHPAQAQVVILPLSQLLGRPMQAVVLPGCDENRLSVSPEPPGLWTPAQREVLGLPARTELADAQRTAWLYAQHMPHLDVLWRQSEAGERLMPSGFVQEVLLKQAIAGDSVVAPDPRVKRMLTAQNTRPPMPTGEALPVTRLSASAYEDLRRCPYRFFALRQLKLQPSDELESELGKRDFGNWLHTLLNHFHEQLKVTPTQSMTERIAMINIASDQATTELGLTASEFFPFSAIWPRAREAYLQWLAEHEASGAQYAEGEVWKELALGTLTLVGKIDRIDSLPDGRRLVMDYKTEARSTTQERIKQAQEDTQLAFYAALLADDTVAAAYVNLGEKESTRTYEQPEVVDLRDALIDSILLDMGRIAHAAPLPALGEGKACDYCAARGLCRKDFWKS